MGEFKGPNTLWRSESDDTRGRKIEKYMMEE